MNIFDSSDIQKQIAEEEAKWLEPELKKEEELPEEEPIIEAEEPEEKEEEAIDDLEEEEKPKDGKGWKEHRERTKALKNEAKEQKRLAEEKDKQLNELRERLARLEGREDARSKPVVEEIVDAEPDKDLDPDEHIRWELRQTRKEIEKVKKQAQLAEEMAKVEGTRRGLQMLEKDYIRNNKIDDYDNAIEHIKTVNRNLIKLEYPTATDTQIDSHLEAERIKKASESVSRGTNPAEYFYKMAQQLGYQKPKSKINDKPNIEALTRNQEKNASLIGPSSADKTGGIPAEKLVKMSIADLLNAENSKKLADEIRRQEAKWMQGG